MTTNGGGGGKKGRTRSRGGKVVPISGSVHGFAKLKALRCFRDAHARLVDGWPLSELARWIQDDQKEYTDIGRDSLIALLHKYRATVPAVEFAKKHAPNKAVIEKIKEAEEGLDELAEMQRLYKMQLERVEIDRTIEKNIKKLLPAMGQEIRTAKEILQAYADLKMDLGLVDRNLGTTRTENITATVDFTSGNPAVQKVLENPESRRKLTAIAARFLTAAKEPEPATTTPIPALPETTTPTATDSPIDAIVEAEFASFDGSDEGSDE
jgi:hypothetical protein